MTHELNGVNFAHPKGISRHEQEAALRMIRQRGQKNGLTTPRILAAVLNWRQSRADEVAVSLINHGLAEDVEGYLLITERGRRMLQ